MTCNDDYSEMIPRNDEQIQQLQSRHRNTIKTSLYQKAVMFGKNKWISAIVADMMPILLNHKVGNTSWIQQQSVMS